MNSPAIIPLKTFCYEEAQRCGKTVVAIYMRVKRGRYGAAVELIRHNRRVIDVVRNPSVPLPDFTVAARTYSSKYGISRREIGHTAYMRHWRAWRKTSRPALS